MHNAASGHWGCESGMNILLYPPTFPNEKVTTEFSCLGYSPNSHLLLLRKLLKFPLCTISWQFSQWSETHLHLTLPLNVAKLSSGFCAVID